MLAIYSILHHTTDSNVWNETVRGYPWFSACSTLSSSPPSPVLEKGPGMPSLKLPRPKLSLKHPRPKPAFNPEGLTRSLQTFDDAIHPVPTFDRIPGTSYQPAQRHYEGLHLATMQDPAPIVDPLFVRPREAPRPPDRAQTLYPEHLQAHLSTEARNNIYNQSRQLQAQEPSPIGDWPKTSQSSRHNKRLPPPPRPPINTEVNPLTQQPLSSISLDRRMRSSGTADAPSPSSHTLGSPIWGPKSASVRRQPPPPLNLNGISNVSHHARR